MITSHRTLTSAQKAKSWYITNLKCGGHLYVMLKGKI